MIKNILKDYHDLQKSKQNKKCNPKINFAETFLVFIQRLGSHFNVKDLPCSDDDIAFKTTSTQMGNLMDEANAAHRGTVKPNLESISTASFLTPAVFSNN